MKYHSNAPPVPMSSKEKKRSAVAIARNHETIKCLNNLLTVVKWSDKDECYVVTLFCVSCFNPFEERLADLMFNAGSLYTPFCLYCDQPG